jgi:molybdenum cofactor cytidylyltransferase
VRRFKISSNRNTVGVGCIIAAAGRSERVGLPKQLLPIRGKPVLQHVVDLARTMRFSSTVVVLGYKWQEIILSINFVGCKVVRNEDFNGGLASSLILATRSLAALGQ